MDSNRLDDAQRKLDAGDNDAAIDAAMAALAAGQDPPRAARLAGRGLQNKGMNTDAILWFDRSLAEQPHALTLAWRGWCRYQRGEQELAQADFTRAIQLDALQPFAHYARGLLHLQRKEPALAEADFARNLETDELKAAAGYQLACLRLAEGRAEEAKKELVAAADGGNFAAAGQLAGLDADTSGWSGDALLALAGYHRSQRERDFVREANALEQAVARLPDVQKKHDALMTLGIVRRALKQWDLSAKALEDAAALLPRGPAPALLGRTLYFADQNDEAARVLERALVAGAEPYEAHQTLAELRFDQGNPEAALASLDRALESAVGGSIARTQMLRGTVLALLGRDAECKAAWLAAEKAGSADAVKRRRERFGHETAADFFDEALEWLNAGRWDQGMEPLLRAAELARKNVVAPGDFAGRQLSNILNNVGNGLRQQGRIQEAAAALEEAFRARPTGYQPLVTLGNLVASTAPLPEGGLRLTTPLRPGEETRAARVVGASDRRRESLAIFDRAAELALGDPYVHYNRGCARMAGGDAVGAASDFKKALAYQNANQRQDALFNLVKSLWKGGRFAEARAASVGAWVEETIEQARDRNIEAILRRLPRYEGNNVLVQRFATTLDSLLKTDEGTAQPGQHPFRFYGIHPDAWREGANMGHVYRLRFRTEPDAATRAAIAKAVGRPWKYLDDDGSTWLWSGPFVQVTVGERGDSEIGGFFREIKTWVMAIHEAAPLEEVVYLNAENLSGMAWETWSLRMAPLPAAHPFSDDGSLFFSAYGDVAGLPVPARDRAFDEARLAAIPERDDDDYEDDEDEDDEDEEDDDDDKAS